jgi:hypothetical protein
MRMTSLLLMMTTKAMMVMMLMPWRNMISTMRTTAAIVRDIMVTVKLAMTTATTTTRADGDTDPEKWHDGVTAGDSGDDAMEDDGDDDGGGDDDDNENGHDKTTATIIHRCLHRMCRD